MAKQKLVNEIRILGIKGMSEEQIEHKVSSNDLESIIASRGIVQDAKEAEKTLAEITEKHNDIKKPAEDISELSSCFREMSDLVQDQSIVIDDIDTKVESSRIHVKRGVEALAFSQLPRQVAGELEEVGDHLGGDLRVFPDHHHCGGGDWR